MRLIPHFLRAAVKNLRVEPIHSPVAPRFTAARTQTLTSTRIAFKARKPKAHPMTRFFPANLLAAAQNLTAGEIDINDVCHRSPEVTRAASEVQFKLQRLVEVAAFRSAIAEAIETVIGEHDDCDPNAATPAAVAQELRRRAIAIDEELAVVHTEHRADDLVRAARDARLRPLMTAVNERMARAAMGREGLAAAIDAITSGRAAAVSDPAQRRDILLNLGVPSKKISDLLNSAEPPDPTVKLQALREQVAALDIEIAAFWAFQNDPFKRGFHLEGMGLDKLVEAQRAATEQVPA